MACATLKRNLDWDAQMPSKRRRCVPITGRSSTSPEIKVAESRSSTFGESFGAPVKLTPERIAQELYHKIKAMERRRQLRLTGGVATSSSSGSEGDASPPHRSHAHPRYTHKTASRALFTFKQVRLICESMLREQEAALRAEYETALSNKLSEQYEAFVRFNLDQVQRRPPASSCMPLGMDAEHHMHQDLVPSYLS